MALTPKQRIFVKEYLRDKNAARSARAAGYSKKTADSIGHENLTKPEIAAAVEAGLSKLAAKADISAERVIKRIGQIAFDKKDARHGDVLKACELLGKHFKLFTDVTEITGKDGGPQVILQMPGNDSESTEPVKTENDDSGSAA